MNLDLPGHSVVWKNSKLVRFAGFQAAVRLTVYVLHSRLTSRSKTLISSFERNSWRRNKQVSFIITRVFSSNLLLTTTRPLGYALFSIDIHFVLFHEWQWFLGAADLSARSLCKWRKNSPRLFIGRARFYFLITLKSSSYLHNFQRQKSFICP